MIERIGARLQHISRLFLLTVSNTFRNKGRIVLTQIVLVLSGLIFMMVISIRDSAIYTVNDTMFKILDGDITMVFDQPERIDHIEELALKHPEVSEVETWEFYYAQSVPPGNPKLKTTKLCNYSACRCRRSCTATSLRDGRWLDPKDTYAIVMNTKLAEDVGVGVGDWVTTQ